MPGVNSTLNLEMQNGQPNLQTIRNILDDLSQQHSSVVTADAKIDSALKLLLTIGDTRESRNLFSEYYQSHPDDASLVKLIFNFISEQVATVAKNERINMLTFISHDFKHLAFCLNHAGVRVYLEYLAALPAQSYLPEDIVHSIHFYFADNISLLTASDYSLLGIITLQHLENPSDSLKIVMGCYEFSIKPNKQDPKDPKVIQKFMSTMYGRRSDLLPAEQKGYHDFIMQMLTATNGELDPYQINLLLNKYVHYMAILSLEDFKFISHCMKDYDVEELLNICKFFSPLEQRHLILILLVANIKPLTDPQYTALSQFKPQLIEAIKALPNKEVQAYLANEASSSSKNLYQLFNFKRKKILGFFQNETSSVSELRQFAQTVSDDDNHNQHNTGATNSSNKN